MANALIIFTPRSGSTIVSDLLSFKYNGVNLDEIFQGTVREPLKTKLPQDIRKLIEINKINERRRQQSRKDQRDKYNLQNFTIHETCLALVKHCITKYPTIIKLYPTYKSFPGKALVEWAIDNNFEVYFTTRRNYEDQLYSYLLALQKARSFKEDVDQAFLNTNSSKERKFEPIAIPPPKVFDSLMTMYNIQMHWYAMSKMYGNYGKVIYYEDHLAEGRFHEIGVDQEMYNNYIKQELFLRPSPAYTVGEEILNWPDIIEIANKNFRMPYV